MPLPNMPVDGASDPIQVLRPGASQAIALGPVSAAAAALDNGTTVIRVVADQNFHIAMGAAATATSCFLPAGSPEYFRVNNGESVNVIESAGAGGTVILTQMV